MQDLGVYVPYSLRHPLMILLHRPRTSNKYYTLASAKLIQRAIIII
jgi:hypothetical protein